jgi:hypothetical protein
MNEHPGIKGAKVGEQLRKQFEDLNKFEQAGNIGQRVNSALIKMGVIKNEKRANIKKVIIKM